MLLPGLARPLAGTVLLMLSLLRSRDLAAIACDGLPAVGSVARARQVVAVAALTVAPDTFPASDPSRVPR